jgi:hypothetical protein
MLGGSRSEYVCVYMYAHVWSATFACTQGGNSFLLA